MLKSLISVLIYDEMSEEMYKYALDTVRLMFGDNAANYLDSITNATDGSWYISDMTVDDVWHGIVSLG